MALAIRNMCGKVNLSKKTRIRLVLIVENSVIMRTVVHISIGLLYHMHHNSHLGLHLWILIISNVLDPLRPEFLH